MAKLIDTHDMTKPTKYAVVIVMTWTEVVLKRASVIHIMLTYTAWITNEFCTMPSWDCRDPNVWSGKINVRRLWPQPNDVLNVALQSVTCYNLYT
jgi:hypothetical protein